MIRLGAMEFLGCMDWVICMLRMAFCKSESTAWKLFMRKVGDIFQDNMQWMC